VFDAQVNIIGGLKLLELCRKYNIKKFVYGNSGGAGSGEPQYLPVDEKHPINPLCPYGVSKHTLEHYLYLYSKIYGMKYIALRYANVYGPRQDPFGEGGVVAIFSYRLLSNKVPLIYGDGEQTRDFVFVGDVADANIAAIEKGFGKWDDDYYNVSTGKEISVNKLFSMVAEICSSGIKAEHAEQRKGEIIRSVLSNSKIKKSLGWQPKVSLADGLRETVDFFKEKGVR
jgi:UDP-glucose 4-epimerase